MISLLLWLAAAPYAGDVRELDAGDYAVREAAERRLAAAGWRAAPALALATGAESVEAAERADRLLDRLPQPGPWLAAALVAAEDDCVPDSALVPLRAALCRAFARHGPLAVRHLDEDPGRTPPDEAESVWIVTDYRYECWEGSGDAVGLARDGRLYTACLSHCSCYGPFSNTYDDEPLRSGTGTTVAEYLADIEDITGETPRLKAKVAELVAAATKEVPDDHAR